jgi:hypothetical protein
MTHRKLPSQLTVLIDTAEKREVPFPTIFNVWLPYMREPHGIIIKPKYKSMSKLGMDYCLEGYESECGIERKADLDELSTNLFSTDIDRAHASFLRLSRSTRFAYLAIEETPASLSQYRRSFKGDNRPPPGEVLAGLNRVALQYNLRLLYLGKVQDRIKVGEALLSTMFAHTPWTYDTFKPGDPFNVLPGIPPTP